MLWDINLYSSGSHAVEREGLQSGMQDPSVVLHKKHTFCFYLPGFVNKFLHICSLISFEKRRL